MLLSVTLLLILTSTVAFYSAKISLTKHTIGSNIQNKIDAENMASLGSFQMLTKLSQNPQGNFQQLNANIPDRGQYLATMQAIQSDRFDNKLRIIEIASTGKSAHQLASNFIAQHVITYPIIRILPSSPLLVGQSISIENHLILVVNPNGAGQGLPVSLWTSQNINLNDLNLTSCGQYEHKQGNCEVSSMRSQQYKGLDIVDSPALFPNDIFAYLTNLSVNNRNQLFDEAQQLSHCQSLNNMSSSLIWIRGDCKIEKDTIVGSSDTPVMLVVEDGNLTLVENSQVIGLVILLTPYQSILAANVNVSENAMLRGALVATESVNFNGQPLYIQFDHKVLENIQNASVNWRTAYVPNSWRNF
ncbi:hypothetical protein [Aliiglaciecola lipolytica]|nr:hypothetical protein [Aliiglaciecola lipolytica]